MKLTILQENLQKAISSAERFVANKSQLPVLGNLLLEAKKSQFRITATNLETGFRVRVGAKVEREGAVTVPAKILGEFITTLSPGKVELESNKNSLKVSSGRFGATLQGIDAGEFPGFPKKAKSDSGQIETRILNELVEKVAFSASSDESRPVLTGVLWDLETTSKLVATDGYRLSVLKLDKKDASGFIKTKKSFLLPSSALKEAAKVFVDSGEETVAVGWSEEQKQVFFSAGETTLVTRLLEGNFPKYQAIIPREFSTEVIIGSSDLLQAVKVAAIFARESANIVKFSVSKEGIRVSANSPQVGENSTMVPTEGLKIEAGEIAFNSRYLLDFLLRVEGEKIKFSMNDGLRPGVFSGTENNDNFLHVIMPVRVQGEAEA